MSGLFYTLITGSAKGQGLASGGILVFNALTGLLLGVLSSAFVIIKIKNASISLLNKIAAVSLLIYIVIIIMIIKSKE